MARDKIDAHPSYGVVSLSRISSSGTQLVGSAVEHRGFVALTVHEADFVGEHDEKRLHEGKQICQVYMSEAQCAEFMTSWNMGAGTSCTLSRVRDGKLISIEPPPSAQTMREDFQGVIANSVDDLQEMINRSTAEIRELTKGRLTKKAQEKLDIVLSVLEYNPKSNLQFVVTRLNEVSEKAMARAKVEIEGAARSVLERMGLGAMKDQAAKLLPSFEPED